MKYTINVELKNFTNNSEGTMFRECNTFEEMIANIDSIRRCALHDGYIIVGIDVKYE